MRRHSFMLLAASCLASVGRTRASEAHFDTLVEGQSAATLTDGGVTLSNLDLGLGTTNDLFRVEQADMSLAGQAGFSPTNVIGFLGYSPGPFAVFTRVKSFEFQNGHIVTAATIEVFESGSFAGNTITLEAYMGTNLVASQTVTIPTGTGIRHYSLAVGGAAFDRARLVGNGAQDQGVFRAVVDDVVFGTAQSGVSFCAGDGTNAACPCGNTSAVGADEGCLHSLGLAGRLRAQGTASLANDMLVLHGDQMPNGPALYFQGTQRYLNGLGAGLGDGLRCVGGTIVRLGTKPNVGGASSYPDTGELAIAQHGLVTSPGTRVYQCWYRNAATYCTIGTFNLSNGLEIIWVP